MGIFKKMSIKLLDISDDVWIFQELADHLEDLVEAPYHLPENIEKLKEAPDCAKNVIYLWHFFCKVSSSASIKDYIYNNDYVTNEHTIKNLNAITAIEYFDLLKKYESAIKLSLLDECQTCNLEKKDFESLQINKEYTNFSKIEANLYNQISEEMPKYVTKYIRLHKEDLFY